MYDTADKVKGLISMEMVLQRYGFPTDRRGRIPCPLHNGKDKNFSYKGDRFKCFVCGKGGSVIDFVMQLFGISFRQALLRLDIDFGLGLTGGEPPREARSAVLEARRREAERKAALDLEYRQKAAEHQYWWEARIHFAPAPGERELHPLYEEALFRLQHLEYWLDENIGR